MTALCKAVPSNLYGFLRDITAVCGGGLPERLIYATFLFPSTYLPHVCTFCSPYTLPPFSAPRHINLYSVQLVAVYIREAHAEDQWQDEENVDDGLCFRQPRNLEERLALANRFIDGTRAKSRPPTTPWRACRVSSHLVNTKSFFGGREQTSRWRATWWSTAWMMPST